MEDEQYRRLAAEANRRGSSVAAVIRDAVDRTFPVDLAAKRAAGKAILDAEPVPLPDDPRDLKREIADAHDRFG